MGEIVAQTVRLGLRACVVDDGSKDETAAVARRAGATVLSHEVRRGRGAALRTGFAFAARDGYQCVVSVDADGQHDVRDVSTLLACIEATGSDMVIGSRFTHSGGGYRIGYVRRLAMNIVTSRVRSVTRARALTDSTSGFCAVRRPLLDQFAEVYPAGFLSDTAEILVRTHAAGWCVTETPVRMTPRRFGRSKTGAIRSLWCLVIVLVRIESLRWASMREPRGRVGVNPQPAVSPGSG